MAQHRYFHQQLRDGEIILSPEESRHAATVLRTREGQEVELFDGQGGRAQGVVVRADKRAVRVHVSQVEQMPRDPGPAVQLYTALPKGPRQHVLFEKCTELGAAAIVPLITARSVVRPNRSAVARWQRYTIEAGKQSGQWWLPRVDAPRDFSEAISEMAADQLHLLAATTLDAPDLPTVLRQARQPDTLAIWIGPEGGFSPEEEQVARQAGAEPVNLGPTILRVETAAVALLAAVRLRRSDDDSQAG